MPLRCGQPFKTTCRAPPAPPGAPPAGRGASGLPGAPRTRRARTCGAAATSNGATSTAGRARSRARGRGAASPEPAGAGAGAPLQQQSPVFQRLAARLERCSELRDFEELLQQEGPVLDAMLLSRFATAAARCRALQQEDSAARRAALDAFCALAARKRQALRPQQLSNILHGLARLGHRPGREPLAALLAECLAKVVRFRPRDLATVLWACARLRAPPSRPLLHNMLVEASDKLGMFNSQDLANTLWALAALGARPPDGWCAAAVDEAAAKLPLFRPQELASTLWALAALGYRPGEAQLAALARASAALAHCYGPQELSMALWGFARQRHGGGAGAGGGAAGGWLAPHLAALQAQLGRMEPRGLANSAWALAALAADVPAPLHRALQRRAAQLLPQAPLQEAAILMCALCRMQRLSGGRLRPSEALQRAFFAATAPLLAAARSADLAQLAWACAAGRLRAPVPWLLRLCEAAEGGIDGFSPGELALLGASVSRLGPGLPLPPGWRRGYAQQAGLLLDRCGAQDLAHIIVALARWRLRPPPEWAAEFFDASCHLLPQYSAQQLAGTVLALAVLRLPPDDIWLEVFNDAAVARAGELGARGRRMLEYGLGVLLQMQGEA
jgi:hypothetical protein